MKKVRLISSLLSIVALLLATWSIFEFTGDNVDFLGSSLNFIYFFALLIAFLCFRISLGYSVRINPIIAGLSIAIIGLSTYVWMDSTQLIVLGKIILGLIPLLIGTTLMLVVKTNTKWSKILQLLLGSIAVVIACCVFLGASTPLLYTVTAIGLALATLALLTSLIFMKK